MLTGLYSYGFLTGLYSYGFLTGLYSSGFQMLTGLYSYGFQMLTGLYSYGFQMLTGENWNEVMYNGLTAGGGPMFIYFLIVNILGGFLLMNLFVAALSDGMSLKADDEIEEEEEDDDDDDDDDDDSNALAFMAYAKGLAGMLRTDAELTDAVAAASRFGTTAAAARETGQALTNPGHNYAGHNYIGHNYIGHIYIGYNYGP